MFKSHNGPFRKKKTENLLFYLHNGPFRKFSTLPLGPVDPWGTSPSMDPCVATLDPKYDGPKSDTHYQRHCYCLALDLAFEQNPSLCQLGQMNMPLSSNPIQVQLFCFALHFPESRADQFQCLTWSSFDQYTRQQTIPMNAVLQWLCIFVQMLHICSPLLY